MIRVSEFFVAPFASWRRALFLGAAICFLLPMILWLKLTGLILLLAAWAPTAIESRRAAPESAAPESRYNTGSPSRE